MYGRKHRHRVLAEGFWNKQPFYRIREIFETDGGSLRWHKIESRETR